MALSALLISSTAVAVTPPHWSKLAGPRGRLASRENDAIGPTSFKDTPPAPTILEPMIPPSIDEDALTVLELDKEVTLAWAATADGAAGGKTKREAAVLSQAEFKFAYPAVALDHSELVTEVQCTKNDDQLTAKMTDKAYKYAKKNWASAKDILFVTAVDSCGLKEANAYFHATSLTFNDSDKSFTAKGGATGYRNIAEDMKLNWGDAGSHNLKRAADKRYLFDQESLKSRGLASFKTKWSAYLHEDWALTTDKKAPWANAAPLWKWSKEGGKEDDSYKKGVPADKDSAKLSYNQSDIAKRGLDERDLDYGLALYCVDCGVRGEANIWGEIDASIIFFKVRTVKAGFKAELHAGVNLGMQAFVQYDQKWEKDFKAYLPGGFNIPFLVDVGPFISVGVQAKAGIKATGSLLVGADINWDDVDMMVDLLDHDKSYARGFTPRLTTRAEAAGEVKASAGLGLPIKLGVGISIAGGVWTAEGALKDTPSINAEGTFKGVGAVADDGSVAHDVKGCYGVNWDIHFENAVEAVAKADGITKKDKVWPLMDPWKSPPILKGCIGYLREQATATTTQTVPQASSTAAAACKAVRNYNVPGDAVCKKIVTQSIAMEGFNLGKSTKADSDDACGLTCLNTVGCLSFSFSDKGTCQLYNAAANSVVVMTKNKEATLNIYDKVCYDAAPCT